MERRKTSSEIDGAASPSLIFAAQSDQDLAMDELSRKMTSWSRLWFGSSDDSAPSKDEDLVRERLLSWLRRCIGQQARGVLTNTGEDISLATSTPLLTAFLGRRAMRELSRRVLDDL